MSRRNASRRFASRRTAAPRRRTTKRTRKKTRKKKRKKKRRRTIKSPETSRRLLLAQNIKGARRIDSTRALFRLFPKEGRDTGRSIAVVFRRWVGQNRTTATKEAPMNDTTEKSDSLPPTEILNAAA